MKLDFLTIEEIDAAIAAQERAKETSIQQANFHAGYVTCLKEIKARMEATEEQPRASQEPPAEGKLVELAKPKRK